MYYWNLDDENWAELIEVAVVNSVELQVELVNLLSQHDDEVAIKYALRFAIAEEMLPLHLVPLVKANCDNQTP